MRRWTLWAFIAAAALLGGCFAGSPQAADASDAGPMVTVGPVEVSPTHGAIDGLVLDASQLPVGGAAVALREPGGPGDVLQEALTPDEGRFVFSLLAPGSYRVTAAADGFASATQLVTVRAGEATRVQVTLVDVPGNDPYLQVMTQAGIISCAFAVVAVSAVCLPYQTEPVFGEFKIELYWDVPEGHQATVSETVWPNTQLTLRNWFFRESTGGDWLGDAMGTAPLRKEWWPGEVPDSYFQLAGDHPAWPSSSDNFTLLAITYYDGSYQGEVSGALGPACEYTIVGYCTGVGATVQQRYDQYVSVFVHHAPDTLDFHTALPDA